MFYYINLLPRTPINTSKPYTDRGSGSKEFINGLSYGSSQIQFGGMDEAPQITPTLEHFTDMSDGESDGESEEDNRPIDIAEANHLFKQDLEEFIEVVKGAETKYSIDRRDSKSGCFELVTLAKSKDKVRE